MPYITTKTNKKISHENEIQLKSLLGKAISIIPGKSEDWLMLNFEDEQKMYFKGKSVDMCYAEVKIFGTCEKSYLESLTKEMCEIYNTVLNISPENVYVKYEFSDKWGWNNSNF